MGHICAQNQAVTNCVTPAFAIFKLEEAASLGKKSKRILRLSLVFWRGTGQMALRQAASAWMCGRGVFSEGAEQKPLRPHCWSWNPLMLAGILCPLGHFYYFLDT